MDFLLIVIIALVALGAVAALFSIGGKDEPIVTKEGDCASCTSRSECKLAEVTGYAFTEIAAYLAVDPFDNLAELNGTVLTLGPQTSAVLR